MIRLMALAVPVMGNPLAVLVWLPLLELPDRAVIRPLYPSLLGSYVAAGTFLRGMMASLWASVARHRWETWFCVCFSLTPLLVGGLTARFISDVKHLVWAD